MHYKRYNQHALYRALIAWSLLLFVLPVLVFGDVNLATFTSQASTRYEGRAADLANKLSQLILSLERADTQTKLEQVNDFFNRHIDFRDDRQVWGLDDYWASPLETLSRQAGDCEDFTIAKFAVLRVLNIPVDKLRLTYVKAAIGQPGSGLSQAHMVLGYYESPNAVPLILDNLLNSIRPATERPDLVPVFGFNSEGLWLGRTSKSTDYDPKTRVSRWRDVLNKIHSEGLD